MFIFFSAFQLQFGHVQLYTDIFASQLQTKLTTSQIRSRINYLIQTCNILVLILYSEFMKNIASLAA